MIHCKDCIRWCRDAFDKKGDVGECRNHSPQYDKQAKSVWPLTLETEWCGDAIHDISKRN